MSRRQTSLLVVVGAALLAGAALRTHRAAPSLQPRLPKADSAAPEPPPRSDASAARQAAEPPPPAPVSRARRAFDRLLAALKSGDAAKITEALEGVRIELVPPPLPDEQNAALLYRKAFEKQVGETDDADADIVSRASDGLAITAAERAKLQGYLDRNRESLALLHKAADLPRCNFGLEYSQGAAMELAHVNPLILSSRLLQVESLLAGKGEAAEIARASLRLSEAVADEPIMMSQLLRSLLHSIGAQANQKEFEGEVSPERLRSLLPALSPDRVRQGYENVLLFQLYSGVKLIQEGGDLRMLQGLEGPYVRRPPTQLTAHEMEYFAGTLAEYVPLAGRPYYEVRDDLERLGRTRTEGTPWYAELAGAMLPAMERAQARQAAT
ncbi:MAG: hypothetical protein HY293_20395 [Planctomycetes bacterium]|nr:hypothetical protein [Planctomycetota bacterium]